MPRLTRDQKALLKSALDKIEEAQADLQGLHESLQETFDERSEKWQESEKGEEFSDFMCEVESKADDASNLLDELVGLEA